MSTIICHKRLGSLAPDGDAAIEAMKRIKEGATVLIDIAVRDNGTDQQRKYFFALLGIMYESQEKFSDFEKFRQYIVIRLGHCEIFHSPDGPVPVANSLKRGAMKKDEWMRLIDVGLTYAENIMGFDRASLEAETQDRVA